MHFHQQWTRVCIPHLKICTCGSDPLSPLSLLKHTAHTLCSCPLFHLHIYSVSIYKCRWECDCEGKDISLWWDRDYENLVKRHDQIFELNIWLQLCTFIWKFAGNVFEPTENGVANMYWWFFSAVLNSVLKSLYENGKHSCILFTVCRTMFRHCMKMHTLICLHLSQHCTALPSPCPCFSQHSVNSTPRVWLLLSDGHMMGEEPLPL